MTGGISFKIKGVSLIEFLGDQEKFYVEINENNRPYKIKSRNHEKRSLNLRGQRPHVLYRHPANQGQIKSHHHERHQGGQLDLDNVKGRGNTTTLGQTPVGREGVHQPLKILFLRHLQKRAGYIELSAADLARLSAAG